MRDQLPIPAMESLLREVEELLKSASRASRREAAAKLNSVAAIAATLAITVYSVRK